MSIGSLAAFILWCKPRQLRQFLCLWNHRSVECEKWEDLRCLYNLVSHSTSEKTETQRDSMSSFLKPLCVSPEWVYWWSQNWQYARALCYSSLSALPFTWSHFLLAHLLSLLPHVGVSHRSDLRTWHLAVYSVPLLTSPELFALTNHKLWNCTVKNYLTVWVWFLCFIAADSDYSVLFPYVYWGIWSCMCAKSLQSCLTLYDPMDCSPPGSSVHGILQAKILDWVAIPFSKASSQPRESNQHLLCLLHW